MIKEVEDIYIWYVTRKDNTETYEFERGSFAQIDTTDVVKLSLMSSNPDNYAEHTMQIPNDAEPVFFRRRSIAIHPISGHETDRTTIHCIGWKRGDDAVYLFILGNGGTLLTSDLQAV